MCLKLREIIRREVGRQRERERERTLFIPDLTKINLHLTF